MQQTLDKLNGDKARHEQLVGDLATRMAMRRGSVKALVEEHKAMSFHQSGYVFVKTLGSGRHGTMKLAKKKTNQHVKHTKATPEKRRSVEAVSHFVAVRVISRCEVRRGHWQGKELLSTKESHAVLLRHVEALRSMDHPNVQREIETFEDPQHIYIVMELYTGGDLLDKENEPLSEKRAAWCINQICSAAAHAHSKGIAHQDLRPDNVHYATGSEDARLVVTDWACVEYMKTPPKESRKHLIYSEYSAPDLDPHERTDGGDMWSIGVMAFALLSFALPFGDHGPRATPTDFAWHESDPSVSVECKDFVQKLLRIKPDDRMSAQEALAHPWLSQARDDHAGVGRRSLNASLAGSMLRFKDSSVLHRTAAALCVDHISGERLYELTKQFTMLDKDGDGMIEKADMIEALRGTLELERPRAETDKSIEELTDDIEDLLADKSKVTALVNLMDTDGDGKISYSDFLAAAGDVCISDCSALCWEAFRAFDRDGNGTISKHEIHELLDTPIMDEVLAKTKAAGVKDVTAKKDIMEAFKELGGTPQTVDEMFSEVDDNHDNRITFEEFMKLVMH